MKRTTYKYGTIEKKKEFENHKPDIKPVEDVVKIATIDNVGERDKTGSPSGDFVLSEKRRKLLQRISRKYPDSYNAIKYEIFEKIEEQDKEFIRVIKEDIFTWCIDEHVYYQLMEIIDKRAGEKLTGK